MIEILLKKAPPPKDLRTRYLRELKHAQEFYVENLMRKAETFEIIVDKKLSGYASVHDATILEFYLDKKYVQHANQALKLIVEKSQANTALCKSFDTCFSAACASLNWQVEPVAFLFRKIVDNSLKLPFTIVPVLAKESDIEEVLSCHDGFFQDVEEIKTYLEKDSRLFIYRINDSAIGCGIIKKIVACRDDYDIGMVVAPAHRQKGYATEIVNHLKHSCLRVGWNPVAGCSIDNLASKRTLERAGFATEHKLLKFTRH